MSDLHKTIRSMITERFQGTLQGTLRTPGTVAAPSAPVVRQNGPPGYFNSSYTDRSGSYTSPPRFPDVVNPAPSYFELAVNTFRPNNGNQTNGGTDYRTDNNVNALRRDASQRDASQPKLFPTAPSDSPKSNSDAPPAQSVTTSDFTTNIAANPDTGMSQSALNLSSISGPGMALNFGLGSAVQGIVAGLSRTFAPAIQSRANITSQLTNTATAGGGNGMGTNTFAGVVPGLPGSPELPKDDEKPKVTPLPPPSPLSNQSMKTDMFGPGEVAQMGGKPQHSPRGEERPSDRFRQSAYFRIEPKEAMNFNTKTESSDNSLKSLIREEIRRRIEEEVGKK